MARDGWILVTGASRDKKADEIVGALAPSFDTIICTAAHHKGADAERIAAAAARANPAADLHVAASIEDAVRLSQEMAGDAQRRIYVAGGLFLAIEYATVANGDRAEDLEVLLTRSCASPILRRPGCSREDVRLRASC